jgi:hypothetical protein
VKITEKTLEVNANHILNIGVDVSSRKLDVHAAFARINYKASQGSGDSL